MFTFACNRVCISLSGIKTSSCRNVWIVALLVKTSSTSKSERKRADEYCNTGALLLVPWGCICQDLAVVELRVRGATRLWVRKLAYQILKV